MVGRTQKHCDQDQEIEIVDDTKKRRGLKQTKLKKPVKEVDKPAKEIAKHSPEPEKPKDNDSELFDKKDSRDNSGIIFPQEHTLYIVADRKEERQKQSQKPDISNEGPQSDFDLEGVSEAEKEEIKRAILLSREAEKQEHFAVLDEIEKKKSKNSLKSQSQQNAKDKTERNQVNMDSDEETQPPESPVLEGFTLEEESESDKETVASLNPDLQSGPLDRDVYDISTEIDDNEEGTERIDSPHLKLHMSVSEHDDSIDGDKQEQLNERHIQKEQKEPIGEDEGKQFSSSLPFTQAFSTKQKPGGAYPSPSLPESGQWSQSSMRSTQGSEADDKARSQASLSQGSMASKASQEHSGSMENVITSTEPLKRHYRNVREKSACQHQYFAKDGMDPVQCYKAILQLFDIYAKNVRTAQEKCALRMSWGEPIKSGQHLSKTIDVKRRGQGSQYMILSDSEEEDLTSVPQRKGDNGEARHIQAKTDTSGLRANTRRRRVKGELDNDILTAETQPYDPYDFDDKNTNQNFDDDPDDKDFCPNVSVRLRRGAVQTGNSETKAGVNDSNKAAEKVETKGSRVRGRRRNRSKVLAQDTQPDVYNLSSEEESKEVRDNIPVVVAETQISDDEDYVQQQKKSNKLQGKFRQDIRSHLGSALNQENSIKREKNVNMTAADNSNKAPQGLRPDTRRRGKQKETVTLVDDTQDSDKEISGAKIQKSLERNHNEKIGSDRNAMRPIRGKRKSFQLKDDSEDEGSIPETQEMDLSPDITVIENKAAVIESNPGLKENVGSFTKSIGSVFNKLKDYISPKAKPNDAASDKIDDEESQSPVIRKKRKLYIEPNGKFVKSQETGSGDAGRHNNLKFRAAKVGLSETETGFTSSVDKLPTGTGVKRLFSRPSSKESNNSDDISIPNSQGSSTLLDDQGDLYSTQINEKPKEFQRSGRAQRHVKVAKTCNDTDHDNMGGFTEANDEDIMIVKDVKKDYSRRRPNAKRHGGIITVKSGNISNFFPKIPKSNTVVNVDSDSDDPENQFTDANHNDKIGKDKKSFQNNDENKNPFEDLKAKQNNPLLRNSVKVPHVKIPQLHYENGNSDDHLTEQIENAFSEKVVNSQDSLSGEQAGLKFANETCPIIPSHFADQMNAKMYSSEGFGGARLKAPRIRKVSETVTSAEFEENHNSNAAADQQSGLMRNKRLRVNRDRAEADEPDRKKVSPVGRISPVMMYPCPLCNQKFSHDIIQIHASECVGDIEEEAEEEEHEAFAEAIHTRHLRGHAMCHDGHQLSPGNILPHHHDNHHLHHLHHGDIHHLSNHAHLHDPDLEEEEEQELHDLLEYHASQNPVHVEDSDVRDVAKDIKISPGEPGEVDRCYICDVMITKGVLLENHIKQCLEEAKQQQMEVDKEGFNKVFSRVNQPAEQDTPRTTRSRQLRKPENVVTITMDQAGHIEREEGYTSELEGSEGTSYSSSWSEGSESDSSIDENVTLASIARPTGSAALITGPWNEKQNQSKHIHVTQSEDCVPVPDWVNNPSKSPIRSFVPISQQKDKEYFSRQFQYKEDRVERQMMKRKKSQSKRKGRRRRKRRKVSKKTANAKMKKT